MIYVSTGGNNELWETLREAMAFDQGLDASQIPSTMADAFLDMETFMCKGKYVLSDDQTMHGSHFLHTCMCALCYG